MHSLGRFGVMVALVVATLGVSACEFVRVPGLDVPSELTATNLDFDADTLRVSAGTPFVIRFRNADAPGILHTVAIRGPNAITIVRDQSAIDGQTTIDYEYDALPPGDYVFICNVHPIQSMTGVLQVR